MQHAAAVSNHLHPAVATTSSPAPRRASWPNARPSSSVKVRSSSSMRSGGGGGGNGSASTDSLDHLQRASMARQRQQQQQQQQPRPRRVIHTTPFGLWDSFPEARTLDQMVRTMERIMDGDDGRFVPAAEAAVAPVPTTVPRADSGRRGRTPWEVRERAGEYLVRFDMPGMARDDVRVSVQDRTLVVVAEKQQQKAANGGGEKQGAAAGDGGYEEGDEEEAAWPAASFGRYRTRVELPENVDVERIGAEVRDGVLYLTIPKLSAGGKVLNIQVH